MFAGAAMVRSLIWIEGDAKGWACSNCHWRFPVPTLLSGEEAKSAYDRLAAVKFRDHQCDPEPAPSFSRPDAPTPQSASAAFSERARTLVKRGYTPKVAVELVVHEMGIEHGNDPKIMEEARANGEDFLRRARKGLI